MTEQLKTMMDRAAAQDFAAVDLDAITGAGDRTLRRRRIATGVAGVAVLAVIGATAAVLGGDGDGKADFSDDPFRTDVPMWTEGSTLHTPDQTYELGVDVFSFVRTSQGIVFTGVIGEEKLGVYSFTGEGDPTQIGQTDDPHLRSDPDEPFAGWLDRSGDGAEAVVIDQGTGERIWSEPAKLAYSFPIVAIDGTSAYLADADEHPTHVVDLISGDVADLPGAGRGFVDVEGDLTAYLLESPSDADRGLAIRRPGAEPVEAEILSETFLGGPFSPGGRWISGFDDTLHVYDTTTGESVDIGAAGELDGYGYEWADADTLMVAGGSEADTNVFEILSCEIPAGECTKLLTIDDLSQMFSIGSSDLLWAFVGEPEVSTSVGPAVEMESASTDRPE